MENLELYASMAEIFGALTIIMAGVFAYLQFNEHKKIRRSQVAADLCDQFSAPETARAFRLVRELPENFTSAQLEEMDDEYKDAVFVVGMTLETMGLMVFQEIASFNTVDALASGMIKTVWGRINRWIEEIREAENSPEFGEWAQWLHEQLINSEDQSPPAYIAHANWSRGRR